MAYTCPRDRATHTGSPSRSTCSAVSSASSESRQAGWKATSDRPASQTNPGELVLDGRGDAVPHVLERDLRDDLGEETTHDQPPGLVGGDAAGHQVEQRLVVEPAGGAGMAGAGDLAGLDLQVGHRVRPRPVGEDQVAVQLVRVGTERGGAYQHVADPDRVRLRSRSDALQRALVLHAAAAV